MDVRKKLVELIESARYWGNNTSEEIADCLITSNVTVQEWISADDRLPEEECRCLVIDEAGDIEMDFYNGKGRFVLDHSGAVQHPSHWMQLPKMPHPPKGE